MGFDIKITIPRFIYLLLFYKMKNIKTLREKRTRDIKKVIKSIHLNIYLDTFSLISN